MGADPVIYCLEQLTDYDQFERLCHDIMAVAGYRGIEPLGGSKDKGRDALHRDATSGTSTVFAYSVREDWKTKLNEDAGKVRAHGHECQRLVFLCTSPFTANERDEAVRHVKDEYGWSLDLYGLERLASMLRTTHIEVVAHHPHIFCPPFFPAAGGLSLSPALDHVIVDHVESDTGLAHWLYRRLVLAGYNAWCRGLAPLAGASANDTIRELLKTRAFRYVCVLSPTALTNPDLSARRSFAHAAGSLRGSSIVVPALAQSIDLAQLDEDTRRLEFAQFDDGWGKGLKHLEDVLVSARCPRKANGTHDIALRSYFPNDLVLAEPETIFSNLFAVRRVPDAVLRFGCKKPPDDENGPIAGRWGFRKTRDNDLLSLERPPEDVYREFGLFERGGALWSHSATIDGVATDDLLKELLKKTLSAECRRRGLHYCSERRLVYFPPNLLRNDTLRFTHLDGSTASFAVAGERSYGKAERGNKYRYSIAPVFVPRGDVQSGFEIIVRVRVRITDLAGNLYPGPATNARRKKLCKSWWNYEWLSRLLGVMRFLSDDQPAVTLQTSNGGGLVIEATPRTWVSPVRLNEEALRESGPTLEEAEDFQPQEDAEDEDGTSSQSG